MKGKRPTPAAAALSLLPLYLRAHRGRWVPHPTAAGYYVVNGPLAVSLHDYARIVQERCRCTFRRAARAIVAAIPEAMPVARVELQRKRGAR